MSSSLLPRLSINRPVTVLMILLALLLLGGVSLFKLPVQLTPSGYDPAFMMVRVPYPGANPTEVEENILRPLEDAFYTVRGLDEISCRATNDSAMCWVQFANWVDMEETYNEVADRVERLRATVWPDDIERVFIRRHNPNNRPVMSIGIKLPAGLDDPHWLLSRRIVAPLERVAGVAQVDLEGVEEKQIFIEPDREAMEAQNISLRDLVISLRRANFSLSSGEIHDGGHKLLVRSVARFRGVAEIARIPIRADGLTLSEIAQVRYAHPEKDRGSRLDGREAAIVEVYKESEANTVAVSRAVRVELERVFRDEPQLTDGGDFDVLFDQGEVIHTSINQLRDTGLIGSFFALIILYFFLRRLRVTLLITLAIPTSLLAALVVMYFAGASINLITMMGMIICTGMLVDNAVVVVENIDRLRREGLGVRQAALRGASEISLALTMATITTVAVFLPMVLLSREGMMRFMLTKLSLPVFVAIIASLLVALLFIPLAASRLVREEGTRRASVFERATGALYRLLIDPLHRFYLFALRLTLQRRGLALVIVLVTAGATWWPWSQVEVQMMSRHQRGGRQITFFFNLPNSYGLEQADGWFREVEQLFAAERQRLAIRHVQTRFWHNRGMLRVTLEDTSKTDVTVEQAIEGLKAVVPDRPGVKMYVNWQRGSGSDASIDVEVHGEDTATLAQIAEEAERRLRRLEGLISVEPDLENALEEVRIRINREQALRYGVQPEVVSGNVAAALRGQRLPRFRSGEKEIEISVKYPEEDRRGVGKLAALQVHSASGRRIALDALADLSITRGFGDIQRKNRRTTLGIKLNTTRESVGPLRAQVQQVMDSLALPRGYDWGWGASRRWEKQENSNMMLALALSFAFIYLIMGFLFESFLLPLSVMPSIVLSWIGVFWLLWATGSALDMMAAIGLILLAGVVVNNGIVLVDLVNRFRGQGMGREQAIIEAGRLRFRPILMTALTTIMGMLPMAFGKANFVGIPYASLGKTFVGGLLSSTTLTLVVVPLFYTFFDDIAEALRKLLTGRPAAVEGAVEATEG
ncbi:MAG TPA: efflux RND transporter permease subunit [Acidobacteria bacterium]|nr:efflux RND transporter permease subunit [Acidobacteriota bacterium]